MSTPAFSESDIPQLVTDAYGAKAKAGVPSGYASGVAQAFGYTKEQLEVIPAEANLGLSCGNPVATASIKEGEVVLDLGSGGGMDIFLAAAKVGPNGRAIGLDGSSDMIELARRNAAKKNLKPPHVAFVHTPLTEKLPIVSESVDCILSNCVVNLLPMSGKSHIMKEAFRVLNPGGRIVLDDIIAKVPLPDFIRNDLAAYFGCFSGAILLEEYKKLLNDAGFKDILFVDTKADLNAYYEAGSEAATTGVGCCARPTEPTKVPEPTKTSGAGCCARPVAESAANGDSASSTLPEKPKFNPNEYVASYQIYAVKPGPAPTEKVLDVLEDWWIAYPAVKSTPSQITAEEVAVLIRDSSKSESDFAVIDVRRNDHAGGHVRGSHQWAAQTFPNGLDEFFEKFKNTEKVIFYCQSSNGRGPRCAGWYQDYLNDAKVPHGSKAYVLQGGIKNWLAKYQKDADLVDRD